MAKGRKTGGRRKGTPNKRVDLQEFLDLIEEQIDPIKLAKKFLCGKNPSERVFLRFLEYRYGKPISVVTGNDDGSAPMIINTSAIPRHHGRAD
jgi:hypothetical protein